MYYLGVVIKNNNKPLTAELKLIDRATAEWLKLVLEKYLVAKDFALVATDDRHKIFQEEYDLVVRNKNLYFCSNATTLVFESLTRDFRINIRIDDKMIRDMTFSCLKNIKGYVVSIFTEK